MGGALACCTKLRTLDLREHGRGRCGDGGVRRRARQRRGARAPDALDLRQNKIGDEGMRHLADALGRGAAPALETLWLNSNKIRDAGMRHLGDALARGAAPASKALVLIDNSIGDETRPWPKPSRAAQGAALDGALPRRARSARRGCAASSARARRGGAPARRCGNSSNATASAPLKALEKLNLEENQIGDEGTAPPGRRPSSAARTRGARSATRSATRATRTLAGAAPALEHATAPGELTPPSKR